MTRLALIAALTLAACSRGDDAAQIGKQLDLYSSYTSTNNYFGVASLFAEDGVLEPNIKGPKAIQKYLSTLGTGLKIVEFSIDAEKPVIQGDQADQTVVYQQQVRTSQGNTSQLNGRLKIKWVRAASGRWLIANLATS